MNTKKILILTSNPKETTVLDIDIEMREIREALRRSDNRDRFSLEFRVAVRPRNLRLALLEVKPNIVHFCGHGTGNKGIVLENETGGKQIVNTGTLTELFEIVNEADKSIECVILNACYSEVQAKEIVKHIDYVIGMNQAIPDRDAIAFSIGFYDGLGAGKSIEVAYQLGCNAIDLAVNPNSESSRKLVPVNTSSTDSVIPILKKNNKLGIQAIYIDPEEHIGRIWTLIIPEPNNIDKRHLITINWGGFRWQGVKIIPTEGLLLSYEKRNRDKVARIITVAPISETYEDGVTLITENTQIFNGHLTEPKCDRREDINDTQSWIEIKQSSNKLDWQKLFERAKSIAEDISN